MNANESFDRTASHMAGEYVSNTEPVGYYYAKACIDIRDCSEQMKRNGIPLYTHPVKELTDEDLMEIFYEMTALSKLHCEALTKAILRKAQE